VTTAERLRLHELVDLIPGEQVGDALVLLRNLSECRSGVHLQDFTTARLSRLEGLVSWCGDAVADEDAV
jgi:hypothetical protein